MKKLFSFLFIGLFGLALAACQSSGEKEGGSTQAAQAGDAGQHQEIIVAADTTFPPFETTDDKGQPTGFDIDLVKAIAEKENMDIKFKPMDLKGIIPALQSGLVQMAVAGMTITAERAKVINYSDAYYLSGLTLLAKTGKEKSIDAGKDIHAAVETALQGKIVATRKGSTSASYLEQVKGVKKVLQFDNIDDAYNLLTSGGVDMVLFDNPVNLSFIASKKQPGSQDAYQIISPLLQGEYYGIAVSKNYPDLLKQVNDGFEKIRAEGSYQKLYEKYFGKDASGMVSKKLAPEDAFVQHKE